MEFVEEESRPRFQLQSSSYPSTISKPGTLKPDKLHLFLCYASAAILFFLTFSFLLDHQTLSFLLIWTSLSLLLAPFAPSSVTGGDPCVGRGEPLPPPPPQPECEPERIPNRRARSRRPDNPPSLATKPQDPAPIPHGSAKSDPDPVETVEVEESEWTDEDFEILKKQISKHPVGEPKRWEKIASCFQGRHKLETVIKMGKSLSERRPDDKDSFAQFLKQRKPVDKRVENEILSANATMWSSSEDIALLNALKAFPKEVSMRWEKVAAAVPGRTKGECVKRVAELKKDFRSTKAIES